MKFLITGAVTCAENLLKELENFGHEAVFMQNESDKLPEDATEFDGVFCNGLFLHHPIEDFENLKYIQLTSAGFDRVPMDYVNKNGIKIYNARGVYSIPMAEFAMSGVLSLYKEQRFFCDNQKLHKWEKHRGLRELFGKTVCIVGAGNVGGECAKRFSAFGCKVVGVDIAPYESPLFDEMLSLEKLDSALLSADIVVLTLPLTEETYHLFDKDKFDKMKNGAILVNISRGGTVDTKALTEALDTKLGGAVLDVFEQEPLEETSPLWDMDNVIITPHNSFVGEGNKDRLEKVITDNLEKYLKCQKF